jgi:hypothetical protein
MLKNIKNFLLKRGLVPEALLVYRSQSKNAAAIVNRRIELGSKFNTQFNGTVRYGLFSGLRLGSEPTWAGFADKSSQLFGFYEREVLDTLEAIDKRDVFINLGAADGYYAVGMIIADKAAVSYAYEIDEKSRDTLSNNAKLNNVTERIVIRGEASNDFYRDFQQSELDDSIILCDIEGEEFAVFTTETLYHLKSAIIIIEIHDWVFPNKTELLANLISNAEGTHRIEILKMSERDLTPFAELSELSDDDRWVICSEGRPKIMSWLLLTPGPK